MDYKYSVVIGRFQPFHNDHLKIVEYGLATSEKVIVVIGSSHAAPSTRNPFTLRERADMIRNSIGDKFMRKNVELTYVRDYYYNDNAWLADVQSKTNQYIEEGASVQLLGSYKDSSSYYLKMFPQWDFTPVKTGDINSTDIRESLFSNLVMPNWEGVPAKAINYNDARVPDAVNLFLSDWCNSKSFPELTREFQYQRDYKKSWESAPFAPTFVTADAIVTCSGHVLIIERKINPGKGLFAVPGGFVKQDEFIEDAALRELREETGIRLDKRSLKEKIVDSKVFDYPTRSQRGRTITHGFHIDLGNGSLPEIKGGDDAKRAMWMPLFEAFGSEQKFFEDHLHIIGYFVGAQGGR